MPEKPRFHIWGGKLASDGILKKFDFPNSLSLFRREAHQRSTVRLIWTSFHLTPVRSSLFCTTAKPVTLAVTEYVPAGREMRYSPESLVVAEIWAGQHPQLSGFGHSLHRQLSSFTSIVAPEITAPELSVSLPLTVASAAPSAPIGIRTSPTARQICRKDF